MDMAAPTENDIESISDIVELEKMLEYENDYENRKRIRAQIRLLNKQKNDERAQAKQLDENRNSVSPKTPNSALNIVLTDEDEIKVEKRSRKNDRLKRSQTIATSTSTQNVMSSQFSGRVANVNVDKNIELRENRSESIASIASFTESEFASGSPSPVDKVAPLKSSLQRPQTARTATPEAKVEVAERPSTAKTAPKATADDSSVYAQKKSKYTSQGRSFTMSALDAQKSSMDKSKESTINDLKKRAELRKTDHMIKRVNSMPNGGNSMARSARENILAKLGEDPKSKVKLARSNTFASGGATGVKSLLLKWCQARLRSYSVDVTNYSSSWADGAAFCGLIHSFFPDAFDWSQVHENANTEEHRRSNFTLAFDTAHTRADAEPLIEVEDMIFMGNRPDAKCIFCYLQSLYNKLKKFEKLQKPKSDECAV